MRKPLQLEYQTELWRIVEVDQSFIIELTDWLAQQWKEIPFNNKPSSFDILFIDQCGNCFLEWSIYTNIFANEFYKENQLELMEDRMWSASRAVKRIYDYNNTYDTPDLSYIYR